MNYRRRKGGFALIELIVVMVIIGILMTIVSLNFGTWQRKYGIQAQVQEMATDLNDLRIAAIQKKKGHSVDLKPTTYTFRIYSSESDFSAGAGTVVVTKAAKFRLTNLAGADIDTLVKIDERGYVSGIAPPSLAVGLNTTVDATPNCLVMSVSRVNTGKLIGGQCVFR
jgi:prepilin-type N-terminal cleavage/methylation domain-containing protein